MNRSSKRVAVIRHIVILQFKKNDMQYLDLMEKTRPLIEEIPGVLKYSIFENMSSYTPKHQKSFGVEILFKNSEALEVFMQHPNHFEANKLFERYLADPPFMVLTHTC
jgi:hypothetical protein